MKKISVLMAMLALAMFAAVPTFAYEIDVEEGDVTITNESSITDSRVQNCGASVSLGDENANVQVVENSQIADIVIDGNENEVAFEQSLEQSGFSPEVSTECAQEIAQAASGWLWWF